jgi:hypothetical protein
LAAAKFYINPNVAKAGGVQRQGIKGEDVIFYFEPLITPYLKSSRFPEGEKHDKKRQLLEFTTGEIHEVGKYNGK